jgi:glycosyltransferase involved in cell wall biosynthesis
MKILVALTYYRPHMSGLTIYSERLARALVKMGHSVTVLTSQYDSSLPQREEMEGVTIIRVPVLARIGKGVLMPSFGITAGRLIRDHDVVHLHLPQFDAARVAVRGWLQKTPVIITYHCDLRLPKGILNWFANQSVLLMNNIAALFSNKIITYTKDYADHSSFISRYPQKLKIINPPVELPSVTDEQVISFRKRFNSEDGHPVIGMAARFASEKGVEVLLKAMENILMQYPRAQVWFAGPYENIMGEQSYFERLKPSIDKYQQSGNWKFLGLLSPQEMALFYPNIDILTIPSLNSTEAFGLIQIEAMMHGIPSIASDLPGVRQPVLRHSMGEVIPIGSSIDLAAAVDKIMRKQSSYNKNWQEIGAQYAPSSVAAEYENLYRELIG